MASLQIARELKLPSDAATRVLAFLGQREAGKTYAAMKAAELMLHNGDQVVALDPVGVWYGLRLMPDGKTPSPHALPIFGGLQGDVPLEPTGGKLVADLIVDRDLSCVIDISLFTVGEQHRFAEAFALTLFHRKASHKSPLWLALEESSVFVPEQTRKDPGVAKMLGAFERIGKIGRNYGIGLGLIDQRPQSTNKQVLNLADALFAMRTSGSHERKALREWIVEKLGPEQKSLVDELPALQKGEAYLWSPSWLGKLEKIHVAQRETYNASSTPTGKMRNVKPRPLTEKDMAAVAEAMKETIERAKADDPKALRNALAAANKKIADLERSTPKVDRVVERVEIPIFTDEAYDGIMKAVIAAQAEIDTVVSRFLAELAKTNTFLQTLKQSVASAVHAQYPQADVDRRSIEPYRGRVEIIKGEQEPFAPAFTRREGGGGRESRPESRSLRVPRNGNPSMVGSPRSWKSPAGENGELTKPERTILAAIAPYDDGADRVQISVLTGYARSTRDRQIQYLQAKGFVEARGGQIVVTENGIVALGSDYEQLPTGMALAQHWLARLPGPQSRILKVLIDVQGRAVPRDTIGELTGYARSTRDRQIQYLQARKLVESVDGGVRATAMLFD